MVASPCIAICQLDSTGQHCLGCGRTLVEIEQWPTASESTQRKIRREAKARLEAKKRPGFFRWLVSGAR